MAEPQQTIDYELDNFKHLKYLKDNLYPTLNSALEILMEHLIKTNEVQQHQERLKQKKIRDRLEQKRIEKEKLREELGSDYVSSSDEEDESFGDGPEDILTTGKSGDDKYYAADQIAPERIEEEVANKGTAGSLAPIEEEEDAQESPEKNEESLMAPDALKKIDFNPIQFLAATLKRIQNGELSASNIKSDRIES